MDEITFDGKTIKNRMALPVVKWLNLNN